MNAHVTDLTWAYLTILTFLPHSCVWFEPFPIKYLMALFGITIPANHPIKFKHQFDRRLNATILPLLLMVIGNLETTDHSHSLPSRDFHSYPIQYYFLRRRIEEQIQFSQRLLVFEWNLDGHDCEKCWQIVQLPTACRLSLEGHGQKGSRMLMSKNPVPIFPHSGHNGAGWSPRGQPDAISSGRESMTRSGFRQFCCLIRVSVGQSMTALLPAMEIFPATNRRPVAPV